IKRKLRQIDQIRTCAVLAFCECSSTCEPAGISSHNLYDRYKSFFIFQTETVTDNLFNRSSDIFCCASVARSMIREGQIVVDCLRASDETCGMTGDDSIV